MDGLGRTEEILEATGVSVVHLRPGFFFTNLFQQLDGLRQGVYAAPTPADVAMPSVDPRDIGDVAAARLLDPSWTGRHTQGVHGPRDLSFAETAAIVGEATGKAVAYQEMPDGAFHDALLKMGMPKGVADNYLQMYVDPRSGFTPDDPRTFATTTPTTLGEWAYANLRPALA